MNGLAAVDAAADVGRGDVDSNRFEQVDVGVLKMRDHLRWQCFSISFEVAAADYIRGDHQPQGFRANSRTVRDDEIAKAEERLVFLPNGNIEESVGADDEKNAVAVAVVGVTEVTDGIHGIVQLRTAEVFAGFGE